MTPETPTRAPTPDPATAARVLEAYARAVATLPWYRELLAEQGLSAEAVCDLDSFARHGPVLTKQNTFDRFAIADLAATTTIADLAGVLTSSGHGGRFSFGLTTRTQESSAADEIDSALDAAFGIRTRRTLAINCLPMGVTFGSRCMTVATTSVREDMAVALIDTFGAAYAQIVLVADPLFLKRLTDYARHRGLDWQSHRIQVVVGEEVFGEHFRAYITARLGLGRDQQPDTFLMSSFGVGELGLHLCHETRATVALRRLLADRPALARAVLGPSAAACGTPVIFTYAPSRTYLEVDAADADGFGRLTVSMLDPALPIPLLRYQTGDIVRHLDPREVGAQLAAHGLELAGELPDQLIALRGREREALPNGATVALYKDAVYADPLVADRLSGAVRLEFDGGGPVVHLQLAPGCSDQGGIAAALTATLPARARPREVVVWPYERFPFGMALDHERKFVGYAPR